MRMSMNSKLCNFLVGSCDETGRKPVAIGRLRTLKKFKSNYAYLNINDWSPERNIEFMYALRDSFDVEVVYLLLATRQKLKDADVKYCVSDALGKNLSCTSIFSKLFGSNTERVLRTELKLLVKWGFRFILPDNQPHSDVLRIQVVRVDQVHPGDRDVTCYVRRALVDILKS